jgi:transcriptional repressor NrdR
MKCPYCGSKETEVVETRDNDELDSIRRRRVCQECQKRFTTYERIENFHLTVIKKDDKREAFDRDKLKQGMLKAAEKTSVTPSDVERGVVEIERELRGSESSEIESKVIGDMAAEKLRKIDKVAYIRFASVFRQFVDIEEFEKELKKLLKS